MTRVRTISMSTSRFHSHTSILNPSQTPNRIHPRLLRIKGYPVSHVELEGNQWVGANATLLIRYERKGSPCDWLKEPLEIELDYNKVLLYLLKLLGCSISYILLVSTKHLRISSISDLSVIFSLPIL